MPFLRKTISAALAPTLMLLLGASAEPGAGRAPLGLMGTIPIYWGEAREFDDLLSGSAEPHWARAKLERDFELLPMSYLDQPALAGLDYLLLAQPRALSGEENVALDAWVRDGGQLLLFADPLMTGHSAFGLGDRRRPQDVVLLSPILGHWGLTLEFVEDQPAGPRVVSEGELALPINLAGRFVLEEDAEGCVLGAERLLARCTIGQGQVTIMADAALLDLHEPSPIAEPALEHLAKLAFGTSGEIAGK